MAILDTTRPITAAACNEAILNLVRTYPFCRTELLSATAFQRPIRTLVIGEGPRKVLFSASHHANEWITTLVLLEFIRELADAVSREGTLLGVDAQMLLQAVTIYTVPMVDPDGVDLVVGAIRPGNIQFDLARRISRDYPSIPFPNGWKANLLGTDLNLNYPAGWEEAKAIKESQGFTSPAPRDYVGRAPLNQLETQALSGYTYAVDPALVVALHTQGQEIYWQFGDYEIPGARELGERMAAASGYRLADTPYASSFAGYKDWFIQEFRRPGYTIEAGIGENPLPISQFPEIYQDCLPILLTAALG